MLSFYKSNRSWNQNSVGTRQGPSSNPLKNFCFLLVAPLLIRWTMVRWWILLHMALILLRSSQVRSSIDSSASIFSLTYSMTHHSPNGQPILYLSFIIPKSKRCQLLGITLKANDPCLTYCFLTNILTYFCSRILKSSQFKAPLGKGSGGD